MYKEFQDHVDNSEKILIIQAENPDGDSLSSSLALESIFGEMGKEVFMYCSVNIPNHLQHLPGWDRVETELPNDFDLAIIVDTSSMTLLEKTFSDPKANSIKNKPLVILDHHDTDSDIDFASEVINDKNCVATGELIYKIATTLKWNISLATAEYLTSSIMYDSLGLVSEGTKPSSIRIIADLVEKGVSLAKLDNLRKQSMVKSLEITHYKGRLLQRIEVHLDGKLAYIHIPWDEIQAYSDKYNPSMLAIEDMRLTEGVKLAVALKSYPDGKITGKLRANYGVNIANIVAERFGGGGHGYAAGFKVHDLTLDEVKNKLLQYVNEALS